MAEAIKVCLDGRRPVYAALFLQNIETKEE